MASSIDFVAVDMPSANKLTPHILAAVAEHEREMISTEPRPPRLPPRHAALG
jgi:DNA invertase Pin-like site-specific DNA recombinase